MVKFMFYNLYYCWPQSSEYSIRVGIVGARANNYRELEIDNFTKQLIPYHEENGIYDNEFHL